MKTDAAEAWPLSWPEGWARTKSGERQSSSRFKTGSREFHQSSSGGTGWTSMNMRAVTPDRARKMLCEELDRMRATNVVISSNVQLRADGQMRADQANRRLDDPGVAVYFTLKKKQLVMAQDAFDGIAGNLRSLTLAITALRQLERHGGGVMMERAFAGFSALPPPEGYEAPKRSWREVMNYSTDEGGTDDLSIDEVKARFKTLAKRYHPDMQGGSDTAMQELNVALDDAKRELGDGE